MSNCKHLVPIIAALALAAPLHAAPADASPVHAIVVAQNNCPSLGDAVERVRRQYNGRIVSAETQRRGNREVHVIKVLTDDGKVKTVTIPGCSLGQRG